jgi:hypothetical protein
MATTGKETPKALGIWEGFVPDTDPRYGGGWNYLSGKNLNPHSAKPSKGREKPDRKPEPKAEK